MSGLTLERLLFDPADSSIGPIVGSYLLAGAGVVIGETGGSLDVNVTNALAVTLDGIYSGGNTDPDNVGLIAASRAATPADTDQIERLTSGTLADALVNADIHPLDVASFLMGYNGTTWDRITSTSGALDVNIASSDINVLIEGNVADDAVDTGNPVKVGSKTYDQATALGAVSAAGDRANLLSDLYRRIFINDAPNRAVACVNKLIDDTAGGLAFVATELAGRTRVMIQNVGADPVYVGPSGVTATSGLRVDKGTTLSLEAGEAIALYGIAPAGKTVNCRVFELA